VAQHQVERWEEERMEPNHSLQKSNSIQDSVGNEENGYPVPNPNKVMINVTKEPSDNYRKTLKDKILEEISEKFMRNI
jgi:hypothetical protein